MRPLWFRENSMKLPKVLVVLWACAVMVLGVGTAQHLNGAGGTSGARNAAVQQWFNKMDVSRDGQLQESELRQFIGAQLGPTDFNTGRKLDHAVEQVTEKLDGEDLGITISMKELDQYLHKVLEGVKVSDWIAHSLGLPHYADVFKDNAITVLDFPLLVNDGGKLLETELMVTRVLHRQKILRAMQRQMLGLGVEPGPIALLQCSSNKESGSAALGDLAANKESASTAAGASSSDSSLFAGAVSLQPGLVRCVWMQPDTPGEPAVHKYVLERFALHRPGATWQTVAELDDTVMTHFNDMVELPGTYQYRVAAWNLYGRSVYTFSDDVLVVSNGATQPITAASRLGTFSLAGQKQQAGQQQQEPPQHNVAASSDHGVMHLKNTECKLVHLSDSKSDIVQTGSCQRAAHRTTGSMALAHQHHQQQQPSHEREVVLGDQQQQETHAAVVAIMHAAQANLQGQGSSSGSALNAGLGTSSSLHNDLVMHTAGMGGSNTCCLVQQAMTSALPPAGGKSTCSCSSDYSWHQDPSHSPADAAAGDHHNNALVESTSSTAASAGAAQSPAAAAPNIVWVVDQSVLTEGTPSTAAAIVAQVQLLQSMQETAGVAVAEAAAGQSSQENTGQRSMGGSRGSAGNKAAGKWSATAFCAAWIGRWLKTLLNSLLLLILPACVRLLPVPVLHKLASTLAHTLHLLPWPLQHAVGKLGAVEGAKQPAEGAAVGVQSGKDNLHDDRMRAFGRREAPTFQSSSKGCPRLLSSTTAAAISSRPDVHSAAPSAGLTLNLEAAAEANTMQFAAGERWSGVANGPGREELQRIGVTAASRTEAGQRLTGIMESSNKVGLIRHWPNSPVSSTTGQQLAPEAAAPPVASSARAAAAGPYAGMYGFAWQTGPMTGGPAAGGGLNAASEIQAGFAAMAPDNELQQRQRAQDFRTLMQPAHLCVCDDHSSHGRHLYMPEALRVTSRNRKRCAFPGCSQQFDMRHLRAMMQRHYCGRCQQAFCLAHTVYSPHGPGGGCGAESRCVCCSCIFDFTPEYRLFLMSRNTLQSKSSRRTRSGPPAGRDSNDNGGSVSLVGMDGSAAQQRTAATSKSSPALQRQDVQAAGWLQVGLSRSSDGSLQQEAASSARVTSKTVDAACEAAPLGIKQMKSRMLWSRAWTKATAVVRLSRARQQHQERQLGAC